MPDVKDIRITEIAHYLLMHCFLMEADDNQVRNYHYLITNPAAFRELQDVFRPLGYQVVDNRAFRVIQLVSEYDYGRVLLTKFDSILLLILRLLYVEKIKGLHFDDRKVYVSVKEIQEEYNKLSIKRKLDKTLLLPSIRTLRKYNLAAPVGKAQELEQEDGQIQIYPSILVALSDTDLNRAGTRARDMLLQYASNKSEDDEEDSVE
jgi:hypothetical protein